MAGAASDADSHSRSASPGGSVQLGPSSPALSKSSKSTPPAPESKIGTAAQSTKQRTTASSESGAPPKVTKRRAARACTSCRSRKVRCDVVEGAPCGNCRWDQIDCVVQESRRRKKNIFPNTQISTPSHLVAAEAFRAKKFNGLPGPKPIAVDDLHRSGSVSLVNAVEPSVAGIVPADGAGECVNGHLPHLIYQQRTPSFADPAALLSRPSFPPPLHPLFLGSFEGPGLSGLRQLPLFVKPLPGKIADEDVKYLHTKGALTLPSLELQNALVRAYVEYVHPFMPLLELHQFLKVIDNREGLAGQVSLFLYQAVMFVASAFVDLKSLKEAGFENRRAVRKTFFTRTRLLYDFDYESDRLILVQALLLMTYWYETPDDQKDTWHWMGVAISLAHTIGLHRNPANPSMPPHKQKLWKRIWWSCFMRDRLIALGMRRATRIKDEDFDVPMLEEADFEIEALPIENQVLSAECVLIRDMEMQRQLALMCIEKAKLCICISNMLKAQYSVLNRDNCQPEITTNSTMMLLPNKTLGNVESVRKVDVELTEWYNGLQDCCQYQPLSHDEVSKQPTMAVQRSLLHMVYHTTVSALHRPLYFARSPSQPPDPAFLEIKGISQQRVDYAATRVTKIAEELQAFQLAGFLPTTGVTVVLPAMIIHCLNSMGKPSPDARSQARRDFHACRRAMEKLREIYAAADFATTFVDAMLRRHAVQESAPASQACKPQHPAGRMLNGISIAPGLNLSIPPQLERERLSTPPPDSGVYLNHLEMDYFHPNRTQMRQASVADSATVHGHTPPLSEREAGSSRGLTPSPGASDEMVWSAVPDNNIDFTQWLQFPAEGVNNSDETFMGFLNVDQADKGAEQKIFDPTMEWYQPFSGHHFKPMREEYNRDHHFMADLVMSDALGT